MRVLLSIGCAAALAVIDPSLGHAQASTQAPIAGRTFVVDDQGTVVLNPYLELQPPRGRLGASTIVSGSTRVSIQLNLANWLGRAGRIYMTLPRTTGPVVRASWATGGTLLPGALLSGERALVLAGPVRSLIVRDIIDIELQVDGTQLLAPEALAFGFEIEVTP